MAHRYNCLTGRKEPKKSASERTWYRFRMYHDIETHQDMKRFSRLQETKEKIKEWKSKMAAKLKGDSNG